MMDINCDLGEGYGNDHQIMAFVNSCSIACGGHFGDQKTMKDTMLLANDHNVKIGAHPSYPDKDSFGRKSMDIFKQSVTDSIQMQLDEFFNLAVNLKIKVNHIKPHGALYNDVFSNQNYWDIFYDLSYDYPFEKYYVLSNCNELNKLGGDINYWQEGFADRKYNANLTLQPRSQAGALIQDLGVFKEHVNSILNESKIQCIDNIKRTIHFDTLCVHGDHPHTLEFLRYIKAFQNE
jgi:UPF0271 protein